MQQKNASSNHQPNLYFPAILPEREPTESYRMSDQNLSFADLFEESLVRKEMRLGEVITAEVVRVDYNVVVVNAGLKSEAYIPIEEFKNDRGEVEVAAGDFIQVAKPSSRATKPSASPRGISLKTR
jgi:hypothetical protein